jgi:hypothetical protein
MATDRVGDMGLLKNVGLVENPLLVYEVQICMDDQMKAVENGYYC